MGELHVGCGLSPKGIPGSNFPFAWQALCGRGRGRGRGRGQYKREYKHEYEYIVILIVVFIVYGKIFERASGSFANHH